PTFISLGSPGQIDQREDGRSSVSSIERKYLTQWINRLNLVQTQQGKPVYFLRSSPTVVVLRELMKLSKKSSSVAEGEDEGEAELYINWQYTLPEVTVLDRSLLNRFDHICSGLDRKECFNSVIRPRF